jgi:Zn-dependent membrane protease YugP
VIFDPTYIALIVASSIIGLIAQGFINSAYRKWSQVGLTGNMSGAAVARALLDSEGLRDVEINTIGGSLTDNYDPRTRQLNLSQAVASQPSVAAAGIAAHETGHAIQHARGYVWGNVRTALVPVAQIGSGASIWLIVVGFILRFSGLIWVGIFLYAGAVLFQLVTLPVEIDASRRAVAALSSSGLVAPDQIGGVKQVLTAAALTYVAAALVAAMQLLYFIGLARRN